jgi:hypothetical protein
VAVEGSAARINVVVEPGARQPGGGASQPISPLVMTAIAGAIMVAMAIIIALKIIGRGRRAPEAREAGPEAEAGGAEGVREW